MTYDATEILTTMRRLTYHEHEAARTEAALRTAGTKPENDDFTSESVSEYSRAVLRGGLALTVATLFFTFASSAIHTFDIGETVAFASIGHRESAQWIAVCLFAMSEVGMLSFLIAFEVMETKWYEKMILGAGALLCAFASITANVSQAQPESAIEWVIAIFPPFIAMGAGIVLKGQALTANRNNRAANLAYETALAAYENTLTNAEQATGYMRNWHGSLRDALEFANSHGPGSGKRKRVMPGMLPADWARLVAKELNAGNELTSEIERASKRPERKAKAPAKVSAESEAGEHVAKCPTCEWVSERTYKTSAKAARAYNGHCGGAGHIANLEALQPVAHTNGSGAES